VIFTFGSGHMCSCGLSLFGCYVELPGTWEEARERMFTLYGAKFCGQYETREAAGVERFGLTRIVPGSECGCDGRGRLPWNPDT
jgi:hypothetical protein